MNKGIIFLLGFVGGLVTGGISTYFITKSRIEDEALDTIDEYAFHCEKRIAEIKATYENSDTSEEAVKEEKEEVDKTISNNDGVKKYHKDVRRTTKEDNVKVTEGEKALAKEEAGVIIKNKPYVISEDEYVTEAQSYDKVTLSYTCEDDVLAIFDSMQIAEMEYNVGREELIGEVWRYAPDYILPGELSGRVYVRNDNMAIDFEIIISEGSSALSDGV